MRHWNNSSLGMYVDNGALFACTEEWADVDKLIRAWYTVCEEWLHHTGLSIKPDKTELIYFQKPGMAHPMPAPTRLILLNPIKYLLHGHSIRAYLQLRLLHPKKA